LKLSEGLGSILISHTGEVHLTKHHGLGNDFLVTFVDAVPENGSLRAKELCNRSTGIGADGLIYGLDQGSTVIMRLFNSDGSAAEISGNGMRCFLQAIAMRRGVQQLEIDIDTLAGVRQCSYQATEDPAVGVASVDMGTVTEGDAPDDDTFLAAYDLDIERWATGAVGNPHVVLNVPEPATIDLATVGPQIEAHFPHGVNVHMVEVADDDTLSLYVWERGAGITQACGSGATVAAQRFYEWGAVSGTVTVQMPGGSAVVDVATDERPSAILTGPTTYVGAVEVPHG